MGMNLKTKKRAVPQIPIVSLIDIMVVLLIFFIATTTFRQTKTHLEVALPTSKGMGQSAPIEDLRVSLTITKDQKIFLRGKELAADQLGRELQALRANEPGLKLELEADTAAALGTLVSVWDGLREAGFSVNEVPARISRL